MNMVLHSSLLLGWCSQLALLSPSALSVTTCSTLLFHDTSSLLLSLRLTHLSTSFVTHFTIIFSPNTTISRQQYSFNHYPIYFPHFPSSSFIEQLSLYCPTFLLLLHATEATHLQSLRVRGQGKILIL